MHPKSALYHFKKHKLRALAVEHRCHGPSIAKALGMNRATVSGIYRRRGLLLGVPLKIYSHDEIIGTIHRMGSRIKASIDLRVSLVKLNEWLEENAPEHLEKSRKVRRLSTTSDAVLIRLHEIHRTLGAVGRVLGISRHTMQQEFTRRGIPVPMGRPSTVAKFDGEVRALAARGAGFNLIARTLGLKPDAVRWYMAKQAIPRNGIRPQARDKAGHFLSKPVPKVPAVPRPKPPELLDESWESLPLDIADGFMVKALGRPTDPEVGPTRETRHLHRTRLSRREVASMGRNTQSRDGASPPASDYGYPSPHP